MTTWMNDSGGIRYHLRALGSWRRRWAPFRGALLSYLRKWRVAGDELMLIGPSAGWCLDRQWLSGFQRLVCVDPDPLARVLFSSRMGHEAVSWVARDYFTTCDGEGFERLLDAHPRAPVLFANFLGQLRLLLDDEAEERVLAYWKERLEGMLAGRAWASFHDRFSGKLALQSTFQLEAEKRLEDRELIARAYPDSGRGELFDHLSEGFFSPSRAHAYFSWELTPGQWHLVEATSRKES